MPYALPVLRSRANCVGGCATRYVILLIIQQSAMRTALCAMRVYALHEPPFISLPQRSIASTVFW
jgi:hypothetical protein